MGLMIHIHIERVIRDREDMLKKKKTGPPVQLESSTYDGLAPGAALLDVVCIAQIPFSGLLIKRPGLRGSKHPPWSILPPTAERFTKGAFRTYYMPDIQSFDAVKCLFKTHLTPSIKYMTKMCWFFEAQYYCSCIGADGRCVNFHLRVCQQK